MLNNKNNYELKDFIWFKKDEQNVIYKRAFQGFYLYQIYLSKGKILEPHCHLNAHGLLTVNTGAVEITSIHPTSNEKRVEMVKKDDGITILKGWWYFIYALEDETKIVMTFNSSDVCTIYGSDILRTFKNQVIKEVYGIKGYDLSKEKYILSSNQTVNDDEIIANSLYLTTRVLPYSDKIDDEKNMRHKNHYGSNKMAVQPYLNHYYVCPSCQLNLYMNNKNSK